MQTCMVLPPCRSQTCDSPPPFVTVVQNFGSVTQRATAIAAGRRLRVRERHQFSAGRLPARSAANLERNTVGCFYTAPRSRMAPRCARPFLSPASSGARSAQPAIHLGAATQPLALPHSHLSSDGLARGTPKRGTIFVFYCRSCLAASVSRRRCLRCDCCVPPLPPPQLAHTSRALSRLRVASPLLSPLLSPHSST